VDAFTKAAKLEKLKPVEGTNDAAFHGKITANGKSTDKVIIFDDKAKVLVGLVKIDPNAMGGLNPDSYLFFAQTPSCLILPACLTNTRPMV
jgi:hypothetical protein